MIDLRLGDCLDVMKKLEDNSVDSIVTDPPYGLEFMNKKWDYDVPSVEIWKECYRVLKPGGHLLSFGGSRTYHRMAVAIEDAGFEVRDQIMWVYGSGFPKSHNIGKAVDKIAGKEVPTGKAFNVAGQGIGLNQNKELRSDHPNYVKPSYDNEWEGWGSSLKPAHEPICMARKPLSKKSIAENVLKWGTGGINIDDCRIATDDILGRQVSENDLGAGQYGLNDGRKTKPTNKLVGTFNDNTKGLGRFPANIMFECICDELIDGKEIKGNENYNWNNTDTQSNTFSNRGTYTPRTETPKIHTNPNCPCRILDEQSGTLKSGKMKSTHKRHTDGSPNGIYGKFNPNHPIGETYGDTGGASRFFYCPKVSKKERDMNMTGEEKPTRKWRDDKGMKLTGSGNPRNEMGKNIHPTVKPIKLMEYLITLVTPKGGVVLEPFMGSGSTGIAAKNLGMSFIGIEREEEYFEIAKQRIGL